MSRLRDSTVLCRLLVSSRQQCAKSFSFPLTVKVHGILEETRSEMILGGRGRLMEEWYLRYVYNPHRSAITNSFLLFSLMGSARPHIRQLTDPSGVWNRSCTVRGFAHAAALHYCRRRIRRCSSSHQDHLLKR